MALAAMLSSSVGQILSTGSMRGCVESAERFPDTAWAGALLSLAALRSALAATRGMDLIKMVETNGMQAQICSVSVD